ncbi:LysE/ArgO family amino acid transporter [Consotaella salsifontis]|uniref:L-lysine exporter family protein LysE/ArgO n=1 Tax=Consotaella salsifontis TaxID=1365950 RepID=A0A1T4T6X9_9HYPH|nr:LysE/ArgO family amino acid transporter [Consotaella salsifontis]SKA36177.1 L-lysine exporter family protein LysE/ArgO [Consotaella salsifontis]
MIAAAGAGFVLGMSLIIAIGAQNAFILRQGLARQHVLALCLICSLSDAVLIAAGVGGLGSLVAERPSLIVAVSIGGAAFLFTYAALALKRALSVEALDARGKGETSLGAAVATCLALTFLNPHVYLDTVVLVGSLSARFVTPDARLAYGIGAATASLVWFFALGYGARLLVPLFAKPLAWRILDLLIALVMAALAANLLVEIA